MPTLFPSLTPRPDETPGSFVSRLAALHGRPTVAFCGDLGLDLAGVARGEHGAVNSLARLSGAPAKLLLGNAIRRGEGGWALRGERLLQPSLRRDRLLVCPACLKSDVEFADCPPSAAAFGRVTWQLSHFRCCATHGLALVQIEAPAKGCEIYDFSGRVRAALASIEMAAEQAPRRCYSPLERYLAARLEGRTGAHPWLDSLEFTVAAKACEMLGAVAIHGRTPYLTRFGDEEWHACGAAGFEIAVGGEPSVRDFLTGLQSTYERALGGKEQPNAFYGRFHQWLSGSAADAAYDPLRDLVRRHAQETLPVGPTDSLFGRPFERRILHSLYTASIEYDLHTETIRRLLAPCGLLPDGHETSTPNLVVFRADAAHQILASASQGLSQKEAEVYLNAGRVQTRVLREAGFIKPVLHSGWKQSGGKKSHAFLKSDLDEFLERLTRLAQPLDAPPEGAVTIPKAARLANSGAGDVVNLIFGNKLRWIGRLTRTPGYLGVLVDPKETKAALSGLPVDGLNMKMVEEALKTSYGVVRALLDQGILRAEKRHNPATRRWIEVVDRAEVESFDATYVSLARLAREHGLHIRKMLTRLEIAGLKPALDEKVVEARYYLRAEVRGIGVPLT